MPSPVVVTSWDGNVIYTSAPAASPSNVANPQSQPDTAVHREPEPLDPRHFRRIRDTTPRVW